MAGLVLHTGSALTQAQRWADLDDERRHNRASKACHERDLDELWSLTLSHLTLYSKPGIRISDHTCRSYKAGIRQLLETWSGESLLHPSRDAAALWVRGLEQAGKSSGTIQVRLAGARALYAALRWAGATTANPFDKSVRPAPDPVAAYEKRLPYSASDLARLLEVATGSDRLLVLLAGHAALRNFECLNLKWADVDLDARVLHVIHGKGRKSGTVTISRSLAAALADAPRSGEYVIADYRSGGAARNRLRALCARAGVRPLGVHSLRHSAGTALQAQTHDIHLVARHLRHSSTSSTERYVHLADDAFSDSVGNW